MRIDVTPEDLARDLRVDGEYVRGFLHAAEDVAMGRHDAVYRLQRVARMADAAIRRAMAAEIEVAILRQQIEGHVTRIAAQSELLGRRAEKGAGA